MSEETTTTATEPTQITTKTHRTKEEITKEYTELCTRTGEIAYLIEVKKDELLSCQKRMYALNQEEAARTKEQSTETKTLEAVK